MLQSVGPSEHMNEITVNDWIADILSHELHTEKCWIARPDPVLLLFF